MTRIYLDYAAATPLSSSAWLAMEPILLRTFGNPSSIHAEGVAARRALDAAHSTIAECICAHTDEIVLTSGATESINLAMMGTLKAAAIKGKHVVTVATEHAAALSVLRLAGAEVTLVPVDEDGRVHTHATPFVTYSSAIDLMRAVIDAYPDAFSGSGGISSVDGDRESGHGLTGGNVTELGIPREVSDEKDSIKTGGHESLPSSPFSSSRNP